MQQAIPIQDLPQPTRKHYANDCYVSQAEAHDYYIGVIIFLCIAFSVGLTSIGYYAWDRLGKQEAMPGCIVAQSDIATEKPLHIIKAQPIKH